MVRAISIPASLREEYPFEPKKLKLSSGHTLSYLDEGEGPVVIMAHGNPTWSFYYRDIVKTLKENFRVIVPDHIGCGLSDKPQDYDYTLKNHIDNLESLIDELKIEDFNLIVHDWGGAIGMGLGTRRPKNLKKAVILNTAAFTSNLIPKTINLCKNPIFGEWMVRKFNAFAWPATFMATSKGLSQVVKEGYLLPYNNYENRIATARFVRDIPMDDQHPSWSTLKNIENNLSTLECPKLILWGEKDFCFNMQFFKRWTEIYPKAETKVFSGAGHYVLEDAKEEINKDIFNFLRES
ncbi:putative haloalkane dehalogenase [Halobacteriovorax marinus SJ]|uniref:Haloalkane dehalogenase n=1 Tax=Halobacteriovorax marinus (strain ATCC BAA-682 / DSM 15412 / SJ) TaxID=862908 RepID=E1X075_HALMS|nr:putative haloalkane dehalogenase [Halobacteriovorax marinus SJ]